MTKELNDPYELRLKLFELEQKIKDFIKENDENLIKLTIEQNLELYYIDQVRFMEQIIGTYNINLIKFLFSLKLNQKLINQAFVMCAEKRSSQKIIDFIFSYNPDINFYYEKIEDEHKKNKHYSMHHAISYFAYYNNIEMVKFLIQKGITIENKEIAFRWAVCAGHEEVIDIFLNDKVNINCVDKNDNTYGAINIAINNADIDIIEYLIKCGIDIELQKKEYIKTIVKNDDVEVFKLLLDNYLKIENDILKKFKIKKFTSPELYIYINAYLLNRKLDKNLTTIEISSKRIKI